MNLTSESKTSKDLDSFIASFLDELKLLQNGVLVYDAHIDSQFLLKTHLVLVTNDTSAISKLFQFNGHNAKHSCHAYHLKGISFVYFYTKKKNNETMNGKIIVYYYPHR